MNLRSFVFLMLAGFWLSGMMMYILVMFVWGEHDHQKEETYISNVSMRNEMIAQSISDYFESSLRLTCLRWTQ